MNTSNPEARVSAIKRAFRRNLVRGCLVFLGLFFAQLPMQNTAFALEFCKKKTPEEAFSSAELVIDANVKSISFGDTGLYGLSATEAGFRVELEVKRVLKGKLDRKTVVAFAPALMAPEHKELIEDAYLSALGKPGSLQIELSRFEQEELAIYILSSCGYMKYDDGSSTPK